MVGDQFLFTSRASAGGALGAKLMANGVEAAVVLGIPRGGVPVAAAVAAELNVPLDVLAVDVLGSGLTPEDAIAIPEAVKAEGSDLPGKTGTANREIRSAIAQRERILRGGLPEIDVRGQRAVVVDDGVATGSSMIAAIHRAWSKGAAEVVAAFPAGPSSTARELRRVADSVVYLDAYSDFRAVGRCYAVYPLITDEDVTWIIRESREAAAA